MTANVDSEALIQEHLAFARHLARRMARRLPPSADLDALESDAMLGLVKAARGFDPKRGVAFKTYATQRINGAMLDGLRTLERLGTPIPLSTPITGADADGITLADQIESRDEPVGAAMERMELIDKLLAQLEPSTGQCLRERYVGQMTLDQMAQTRGICESTMCSRMKRLLDQSQKRIAHLN